MSIPDSQPTFNRGLDLNSKSCYAHPNKDGNSTRTFAKDAGWGRAGKWNKKEGE